MSDQDSFFGGASRRRRFVRSNRPPRPLEAPAGAWRGSGDSALPHPVSAAGTAALRRLHRRRRSQPPPARPSRRRRLRLLRTPTAPVARVSHGHPALCPMTTDSSGANTTSAPTRPASPRPIGRSRRSSIRSSARPATRHGTREPLAILSATRERSASITRPRCRPWWPTSSTASSAARPSADLRLARGHAGQSNWRAGQTAAQPVQVQTPGRAGLAPGERGRGPAGRRTCGGGATTANTARPI